MAQVSPLAPFAGQFFSGAEVLEIAAGNLFALVDALDKLGPGFGEDAALRAAFAVDGVMQTDWSAPLAPDAQVMLFPRVAGGSAMADTLPFRTLSPFGVELSCDLAAPLSEPQQDHFRDLFNRHSLILARGQSLSMQRQREICGLLGPILDRPGEQGTMTNEGGGYAASALSWHADAAYTEHPFDALSLHALDVAEGASSTRFVSAQDACDTLPGEIRTALDGQTQEMIAPHYTRLAERTCDQRDPEAQKRGILPTIYTNPHNGRACLWVGELQTTRLLGMEWEASRDLLHAAFDYFYAPERVFEHRWRNGDFIVWDNIALQHERGNLEAVGTRVLQRAIVGTHGVAPHIAVAADTASAD